jgi:hypothetical protein
LINKKKTLTSKIKIYKHNKKYQLKKTLNLNKIAECINNTINYLQMLKNNIILLLTKINQNQIYKHYNRHNKIILV